MFIYVYRCGVNFWRIEVLFCEDFVEVESFDGIVEKLIVKVAFVRDGVRRVFVVVCEISVQDFHRYYLN